MGSKETETLHKGLVFFFFPLSLIKLETLSKQG